MGKNKYFLGMRVQHLESGMIQLSQQPYWEHTISQFSLEYIMPRNTPLPPGIVLDNNMSLKTDLEKRQMDNKPYHSILGLVMWGQLATHPDLSFSVSLLAHFQANPRIKHWKALMHVIGYTVLKIPLTTD